MSILPCYLDIPATEIINIPYARWIIRNLIPIPNLLGIFGNIMNFIVFRKMKINITMKLLFLILTECDFIVLSVGPLLIISQYDVLPISFNTLLAVKYVGIPAYVMVGGFSFLVYFLITIQRFIAVCLPHSVKNYLTIKRTMIQIIIAFVVSILAAIPSCNIFNCRQQFVTNSTLVINRIEFDPKYTKSQSFMLLEFACVFIVVFIPLAGSFVLNLIIILNYKKMIERKEQCQTKKNTNEVNKEKTMFILLNSLVTTNTICILPLLFSSLVFYFQQPSCSIMKAVIVALYCEYINFALPCYIHLLTNAEYRKVFRECFQRKTRIEPN